MSTSVCPHGGRHLCIQVTTNTKSNRLEKAPNIILFWVGVWLFGGLSRNQFELVCSSSAKNQLKITRPETETDWSPKQVKRSPRRYVKNKGDNYIFVKRSFLFEVLLRRLKESKLEYNFFFFFLLQQNISYLGKT